MTSTPHAKTHLGDLHVLVTEDTVAMVLSAWTSTNATVGITVVMSMLIVATQTVHTLVPVM